MSVGEAYLKALTYALGAIGAGILFGYGANIGGALSRVHWKGTNDA